VKKSGDNNAEEVDEPQMAEVIGNIESLIAENYEYELDEPKQSSTKKITFNCINYKRCRKQAVSTRDTCSDCFRKNNAKLNRERDNEERAREALIKDAEKRIEDHKLAADRKKEFKKTVEELSGQIGHEKLREKIQQRSLESVIESSLLSSLPSSGVVSKKTTPEASKRTSLSTTPKESKQTPIVKKTLPSKNPIRTKRSAPPSSTTSLSKVPKNDDIDEIINENRVLKTQVKKMLATLEKLPDLKTLISQQQQQLVKQDQQIQFHARKVRGKRRLTKQSVDMLENPDIEEGFIDSLYDLEAEEVPDDYEEEQAPSEPEDSISLFDFETEDEKEEVNITDEESFDCEKELDDFAKLIGYDRNICYLDPEDHRTKYAYLFDSELPPNRKMIDDARKMISRLGRKKDKMIIDENN